MRIPEEMQALRIENLEIARMETSDMFPQRDMYHMSVVSGGREHRIFYSWPELKGHKYCQDYFARQDKINREIAAQTEKDVNEKIGAFEKEKGKAFEEEEEENIIFEGNGIEKELF